MRRQRVVNPVLPAETGSSRGLAYSLWLPEPSVGLIGGVVLLHGANSCKENQHNFARAGLPLGLAAIAFDQRGHGESEGAMDDRVLEDIVTMADRLRSAIGGSATPVAVRGSSLGGCLAILAATPMQAAAVVSICPAGTEALRELLASDRRQFDADVPALARFFGDHDLHQAVGELRVPLLLLHAEGDERVPIEHSRELAVHMTHSRSRLIAVPGGHHSSIQQDPELSAVSLRFIAQTLTPGS